MGKTQRSKRARAARKAAVFCGMRGNTGHPSHIRKRDGRAVKRLWERKYERDRLG
jgi:hypothetical protein